MNSCSTRCQMQRNHSHSDHARGSSSFWMHDAEQVFQAIQLQAGDCFLDLGCGPGDYALHAARLVGAGGLVYALDRREENIQRLTQDAESQGVANIKAIAADMTATLPFADYEIDVCFIATALHTLDLTNDGPALFHEIARVLKPGGRVVVIECKKEPQTFGPPINMRISPEELTTAIAPHGFAMQAFIDLGNNYLLRFGLSSQEAAEIRPEKESINVSFRN